MDQRPALLGGWLYVPYEVVGGMDAIARMKSRLTVTPKFAEPGDENIRLYSDQVPGYLGIPRALGRQLYPNLPVIDRRVKGRRIIVPRLPDPNHPSVRDPALQAQFMADLEAAAHRWEYFNAKAPTGSGKTVCALRTAATLGYVTMIVVHLERLMDQWVEEIKDKLGVDESRIGIVKGNTCQFEGRDFIVAMVQSLASREHGYPRALYRTPGIWIGDEIHKMGSRWYAKAVAQTAAYYSWGMSATTDRSDGGDKVYMFHMGPVRVRSQAPALPCEVHAVHYRSRRPLWGNNHMSRIKCLSLDPARNDVIAGIIKQMYDRGRQALVVGEGIVHLQKLMRLAARLGVPMAEMGQYTGERIVGAKEVDGKQVPIKEKVEKAELDRIKANSRIIFATYGMMTEGIDIPRLDAGIDATPRGKATQVIGRIRRPRPGKKKPVWVTIVDDACRISLRYYQRRRTDYTSSNAEVFDGPRRPHD